MPNYLKFETRNKLFETIVQKDTKKRPIPGTNYVVPKGGFLDTISLKAYGYNRVSDIEKANEELLKSRNRIQGIKNVYPGDVIWLPPGLAREVTPEQIDSDSPDEIAIRINGKIFKGYTASNINRSLNSVADGFSFTAPFNPSDPDSVYLDPHTFLPADIFIGGELYISGRCEKWDPAFDENSTSTNIQVRSLAGVLVDCVSEDKQRNYISQSLSQITNKLLNPFGIKSIYPDGDGGIIDKSKRNPGDKIYSFLQGLAKIKGYIINSTVDGGISYDRANIKGKPIFQLKQGNWPLLSAKPSYDGTKRFSQFTAIAQGKKNVVIRSSVVDKSVPVKRPTVIDAKYSSKGNVKEAAEWARSRSLSSSSPCTVTVATWRDDNGDLIKENNIVTLLCPNVSVYRETRYLIEKVQLAQDGKTAQLTLVLPEAYTLEFPEVFPWQR